jgi:hypothetical protein
MATYAVAHDVHDTYAEQADGRRFKTREEADAFLHEADQGRFAIMYKWENNECREVARVNDAGS